MAGSSLSSVYEVIRGGMDGRAGRKQRRKTRALEAMAVRAAGRYGPRMEELEPRLLLSTTIISDAFSTATQANLVGWTPTVTDLPASTWQLASGDGSYEATVVGSSSYGTFYPAAKLHNTCSGGISLASSGSYTKPTQMTISGNLAFGATTNQYELLGFYSALAGAGTYNPLANFTGLEIGVNGAATLIQNGTSGTAIAWSGSTFTPVSLMAVSYSIDTSTGAISSVSLAGSNANYNFSSTAFTNTATAYAGIGGQGDNTGLASGSLYVENFLLTTPSGSVPAAPTGLAATAASTSQINLTWNTDSGATSYNVYRGTSPGGENGTPIATGIATTSYSDTGLSAGTAYYYKVAGVNGNGTGPQSSEAGTMTITAAPTGLSATPASSSQINLTWNAVTGAATYNIYRSTTSGNEGGTPIASGISSPSYSDTGLSSSTTYYYKVAAVDSGGTSAQSSEASATTNSASSLPSGWSDADIGTPSPAGSASYSSGNWTDSGGGADIWGTSDQFNFASESATGDQTIIAEVNSQTNTNEWAKAGVMFRDSSAAGAMYALIDQTPSHGVQFEWRTSTGGSAADAGVYGPTGYPEWVKLVKSGTSYSAYYSSNGSSWTQLGSTETISFSNGTYLAGLVVCSHNNGTASTATFSNVSVSATAGVPAAPTGLAASAASTSQINLTWNTDSGATSYNIYRGTTPGGENSTPIATGIATTSYSDTGLTAGTAYYYKVAGVNGSGTGAQSSEAGTMTIPAAPTGLSANAVSSSQINLTWNAVTGASSYSLYRSTTSGNEGSTPIVTGISGTSYSNTGLSSSTTYYYKLAAVDSGGTSAQSSESYATTPAAGSITWANASGHANWNDTAAWVGGVVPGASTLAIFPSAATIVQPNLTASTSVGGLSINDSSAAYSLTQSGGTWTLTVGSQGIALTNTSATAQTTTINPKIALGAAETFSSTQSSGAATLTIAGVISGSNNLTTSGNGSITLSAANTYTGTTTVSAGTLLVTGSLASGSAVAVHSGGTLAGTGTVSGAVTEASGGTIQAGTPSSGATGILTLGGNLTLASGGTFKSIINSSTAGSGYDQVVVAGTISLASATLTLSGSGASYSNQMTLIQNNGSSAISGTFANLPQNGPTTGAGVNYNASYTGGSSSRSMLVVNSSSGETSNTDPFGIGSSGQTSGNYATWDPLLAQAGAKWVRNLPGWGTVEPSLNSWSWTTMDAMVYNAAINGQNLTGILGYNAPWLSDAYPQGTTELSEWSTYVSGVATHCKGTVEYYEVWNEPESFGPVPASGYASLVSNAYTAAHGADSNAKIGLTVADDDVNYLEQAIDAMVTAGNGADFDFLAVHPYSDLGGLDSPGDNGYEAQYMSIVPTLRKMLAADDPSKANVPIWITEQNVAVGQVDGTVTETATTQAQDLVKAYSMNIAQGVAVTQYFEAQGNSYNMGLLDNSYNKNPAWYALQTLTTNLGTNPTYKGWVQLNANQDYGFVFQGASTSVMVLWAAAGVSENVTFTSNVQWENPITQVTTGLNAGTQLALTNAPVLILGVPTALVTQAQADISQPFPWGGNYSGATTATMIAGSPNTDTGLHQMEADATSSYAGTINGQPARDCSLSSSQQFTVDANFLSYTPTSITITATTCLKSSGTGAGFNLKYESTTGWASIGWNSVSSASSWNTFTWTITTDEFDAIWGYNFKFDSDSTANSQYYLNKVTVTRNGGSQVSLSSNFNAIGLYNDNSTFASTGGLDAAGDAYSATTLGSSRTINATVFNLGAANANDVVNASGQTITLTSGHYSDLAFLGAATGGSTQSGTFTVNYSDSTHQTFTQSMSDWLSGSTAAGETVASSMTYYDKYDGTKPSHSTYLYLYTFAINAAKTVSSITLPSNSSIHLLSIDLLA